MTLTANILNIIWENAEELLCPYQRFSQDCRMGMNGAWLSYKKNPPCRSRRCRYKNCYRYGKYFKPEKNRFCIVPKIKENE